jgi:tRNA nucleotidyltransferase (CCA-adding enzyme)
VRAAVDEFASATGIAPALRGDEVIALGVPRGPAVAQVLDRLRDARLDGEVRDRDSEAGYVRHWVETREEG